jgi:hypothetical protein
LGVVAALGLLAFRSGRFVVPSQYNPGMKTFDIWSEGYRENVGSTPAEPWGQARGETFRDAVLAYAATNAEFNEALDAANLTVWGCRLFPTEAEARVAFG